MKWTNKGHEIDEYVKASAFMRNGQKKYYIFGAGFYGKELLQILREYEFTAVFIDNNVEKQNSKIEGVDVISLDHFLKKKDGIIVIAASEGNRLEIVEQLESKSLKHGVDFWLYEEFANCILPIIFTYLFDKVYIPIAQITLTERCSLKCKKCAHGCFAVDNKLAIDLTLLQVCKSADAFFSKVDNVYEFVLIGGEPLLYRELDQVICYIGEKYRGHMGVYSITTNGTIIPEETVLKACKKYNVLFRISNYSGQIPRLKNTYQKLTSILEQYDIAYMDRKTNEEELIKVFDACKTPCREIRENKLYYCVMARSVSDNLGYHVGMNDYLDLDKLEGENYKKELLEFTLGYSEKGYLDMCNYCHGKDAINYPVPAAEQIVGKVL